MEVTTIHRSDERYPEPLRRAHRPPDTIYCSGADLASLMQRPRVAIVGSRKVSAYGQQITRQIARQLAEQGIVIVSGLAIGVDAIAHQAALEVGGLTLAVLPSPVQAIAPGCNYPLARRILAQGGALMSSYAAGTKNHKGNFVERNEYVAALSDAVVITEAAQRSGSLHTAKFAQDMGIYVAAVPGNVNSPMSAGTNELIHSGHGQLVTGAAHILQELKLSEQLALPVVRGDSPEEQCLLDLLAAGVIEGADLVEQSGLPINIYNQTLTMLEITGKVRPLGANRWGIP